MAQAIQFFERSAALPVRRIGLDDLRQALAAGIADFRLMPTYLILLALIYPVVGLVAARWAAGREILPLLYPLVTGFALVGPLAAVGLYELSRRRERGLDASPRHFFDVLKSPALGQVMLLGGMLLGLFGLWLLTAIALYSELFGAAAPATLAELIGNVVRTPDGWKLIAFGNLIGFGFAVVVLATCAVSFPLVLDRGVSAPVAVATSVQAFAANPVTMLAWGAIVAASLAVGALPLLVGLAVVMPVLGHATWHLYRRVVV